MSSQDSHWEVWKEGIFLGELKYIIENSFNKAMHSSLRAEIKVMEEKKVLKREDSWARFTKSQSSPWMSCLTLRSKSRSHFFRGLVAIVSEMDSWVPWRKERMGKMVVYLLCSQYQVPINLHKSITCSLSKPEDCECPWINWALEVNSFHWSPRTLLKTLL